MNNQSRYLELLSSMRASFLLLINIFYLNLFFYILDVQLAGESALSLTFYTPFILEGEILRLVMWPFIHNNWIDMLIVVPLNLLFMGYYLERIIGTNRFILSLILNLLVSSLLFLIFQTIIFNDFYYYSMNIFVLTSIGQLLYIFTKKSEFYLGMNLQSLILFIVFYLITYFTRSYTFGTDSIALLVFGILTGYLTAYIAIPKYLGNQDSEDFSDHLELNSQYLFCPFCGARRGQEEYCIECNEKMPIEFENSITSSSLFKKELKIIGLFTVLAFIIWPIIWGGLAIWNSVDLKEKYPDKANKVLMIVVGLLIVNWIISSTLFI